MEGNIKLTREFRVDSCQNQPLNGTSGEGTSEREQRAKIFAALSDPTRLKIVELLALQEEMSGSEIAAVLGISLALFCHHSKTLAEAGLVQIRREGQTKYNSLNRDLLLSCLGSFKGLALSAKIPESTTVQR